MPDNYNKERPPLQPAGLYYWDGSQYVPVSPASPLPTSAVFSGGDIEIGAVEIKDRQSNDRVSVVDLNLVDPNNFPVAGQYFGMGVVSIIPPTNNYNIDINGSVIINSTTVQNYLTLFWGATRYSRLTMLIEIGNIGESGIVLTIEGGDLFENILEQIMLYKLFLPLSYQDNPFVLHITDFYKNIRVSGYKVNGAEVDATLRYSIFDIKA
jgi:hypothetical protein